MAGKRYSDETKREICNLLEQGFRAAKIAKDYGISESTIKHFPKELARKDKQEQEYRAAKESVTSSVRTSPEIKASGDFFNMRHKSEDIAHTSVVLVIPDLHCPFEHPDALAFLKAVKDKVQPDKVVCLGDEIDAHAFSRFPHDPDGMSPGHEMSAAVKHLLPFYLEFPEMLVCESNHTVRGHKKAFESGIPAAFMVHISKVLNAPDGWVWKHKHIIDNVIYVHGEGKSGFNAHIQFMRGYRQSVVIGHIHSYAAVSHEGSLFAVNSGCLIDVDAYCFKYAKHMTTPVSLGCSIISHGKKAAFIPLITDADGRWIGTL